MAHMRLDMRVCIRSIKFRFIVLQYCSIVDARLPRYKEPMMSKRAQDIADHVEAFVRDAVIPYERDETLDETPE